MNGNTMTTTGKDAAVLATIESLRDNNVLRMRDQAVAQAIEAGVHWTRIAEALGTTRKATVYEHLRRHRDRIGGRA